MIAFKRETNKFETNYLMDCWNETRIEFWRCHEAWIHFKMRKVVSREKRKFAFEVTILLAHFSQHISCTRVKCAIITWMVMGHKLNFTDFLIFQDVSVCRGSLLVKCFMKQKPDFLLRFSWAMICSPQGNGTEKKNFSQLSHSRGFDFSLAFDFVLLMSQ